MSVRSPDPTEVISVAELSTQRARALVSRTTIGVLAELLAVVTVSSALFSHVEDRQMVAWWGYMALIAFLRLGHWMYARPDSGRTTNDRWLAALWGAAGVGWGAALVAFFPLQGPIREGLILLVVCANLVLALEVLHASRSAMLAYAIPVIGLPAARLATTHDPIRYAFAALLLVFLALVLFGYTRRFRQHDSTLVTRIRSERRLGELAVIERSLRESIVEERVIFESALVGIAIVKDRDFVRCNRRMEEILGFARGALDGTSTRTIFGDGAEWNTALARIADDLVRSGWHDEERSFVHRDGRSVWCRYRGQIIDRNDPSRGSIWVIEDLTQHKQAAQAKARGDAQLAQAASEVRAANERLLDAFNCVPDAFALFDDDDRLVTCNSQFAAFYSAVAPQDRLIGMTFEELLLGSIRAGEAVPAEYRRNLPGWVAEVMRRHRNPTAQEFVYQAGDGLWWCVRECRTGSGGTVQLRTDITEIKRAEERIRHLAHHDPLTGLPNRRLLDDRLDQACHFARRSGQHVGVMLVDLDNFKGINDEQGHEVGDRVLREAARRLRESVREVDTVARHGGDEFVVVLAELRQSMDAARIARKILQSLIQPIVIDGRAFRIGASIGISTYPNDGLDPEGLLKKADVAMYRAKASGRGRFEFAHSHQPVQPELELS